MPHKPRVLVIGTTPDYIDWIADACPGQALFITDPSVKSVSDSAAAGYDELICNLADYGQVLRRLKTYLDVHHLSAEGVACFDCESMELAAVIAWMYNLPFPSMAAIHTCRSKRQTRLAWHNADVPCPMAKAVSCQNDVINAWETIKKPVVIKPDSGSGSELVFMCRNKTECRQAYRKIKRGLEQRASSRIYCDTSGAGITSNMPPKITIEEFVDGAEYSCDFILDNHRVSVLRLCRKTLSSEAPFGTALAYTLINALPVTINMTVFEQMLVKSAEALGLSRAICMLDMIVRDGQPVFLEMAPRPGGDCIPFLLKTCRGLDILKLSVDFSRAATRFSLPETISESDMPCTGVRLHADQEGIIKSINTRHLTSDPRVHDVLISRTAGHPVRLPPEDYDSWLLGHVIMTPRPDMDIDTQVREIAAKLEVEYDPLEIRQPRQQPIRRYAPTFSEGRHPHPAGRHPAASGGVLLQPGGQIQAPA